MPVKPKERRPGMGVALTLEQRAARIQAVFIQFAATEHQPAIFSVSGVGKRAAGLANAKARQLLTGEQNTAGTKLHEKHLADVEALLTDLAEALAPFRRT